jgi:hypothetical protein
MATPSSDVVMLQLRVAHLRTQLASNEIDTAAIAFRDGWIDGVTALSMLDDGGMTDELERRLGENIERLVRERQATLHQHAKAARQAERSTWDAVLWVLRECGMARLYDPWVINRLARFSPAQVEELVAALTRLNVSDDLIEGVKQMRGRS